MPYMNGFELYTKLRNIDNKVRVYFLTALSDFQDYEEQALPKDDQKVFYTKTYCDRRLDKRATHNTIIIHSNK